MTDWTPAVHVTCAYDRWVAIDARIDDAKAKDATNDHIIELFMELPSMAELDACECTECLGLRYRSELAALGLGPTNPDNDGSPL